MVTIPVTQISTGMAAVTESGVKLRLVVAYVLALCYTLLYFGGDFDSLWHSDVGRDEFLIPPHIIMYSATAIIGLMCVGIVLVETWRYYRGRTEQRLASNTVSVFRLFHAPLGFIVTGFGALIMLSSAWFDDYWHRLYGIDAMLYSPFHMMAWLGTMTMGIGLVYTFSGLIGDNHRVSLVAKVGMLLAGFGLLNFISIAGNPGAQEAPTFTIGIELLSYPLFFAFFLPLVLVMFALRLGPGWATALAVLVGLHPFDHIVVGLMWVIAQANGWPYFTTAAPDRGGLGDVQPLWLPLHGLLVDLIVLVGQRRAWVGPRIALVAGSVVALSTALLDQAWRYDAAYPQLAANSTQLLLISLPFVLLAGVAGARLGEGWYTALVEEARR